MGCASSTLGRGILEKLKPCSVFKDRQQKREPFWGSVNLEQLETVLLSNRSEDALHPMALAIIAVSLKSIS